MAEDTFVEDSFVKDEGGDSFVEDSFVADEPEKKNSVLQSNSDSGSLESTENQSESAPHSISNNLPEKPLLQPSHKVVANESIINSTKNNFVNNPLFQDSNPNAKKNKEIYINHLVSTGIDKGSLQKIDSDIIKNKELLNSASQRANANPNDFTATYDAGTALLGLNKPDDAIAMFNATLGHLGNSEKSTQGIPNQNELSMNTQITQSGALNPANSLFGIGTALSQKGDYQGAINSYSDALKEVQRIDPTNKNLIANINSGLAYSKYKLGDKAGATQSLKQANELRKQSDIENKPYEALKTQIGEEATAEKEQQRQADYMNTIANGLEDFIKGDPENKLGSVGKLTPWGFVGHSAQEMIQGAGEGLKKTYEGIQQGLDTPGGFIKTLSGGAKTVFSLIPQVQVFNNAVQPIQEAANANPDNKALQLASDITTVPFSLASHIAKWTGNEPTSESGKDFLEAIDLLIPIVAHGAYSKKIKSINDLKDLSQKVADNKATPEEVQQAQEINNNLKDLTVDKIQSALKNDNSEKAKEVLYDIENQKRRDEEVNQIQSERKKRGIEQEDIFSDIPTTVSSTIEKIHNDTHVEPSELNEAKDYLFQEYNRLSKLKKDSKRMFTSDQINDAMDMLDRAAEDIDKYRLKEDNISPELKELRKQKADLDNANVSDVLKPEIEKAKEELDAKIINQTKVDSENALSEATEASELNDVDEGIKMAKKDIAKSNNPTVSAIAQQKVDALNARKAEIEAKNVAKNRAKMDRFTEGKTAESKAIENDMQFSSPEEATRYILENSENPAELATEYLNMEVNNELNHKSQQIENYGIKMTDEEFNRNFDKNKKNFTLAKKYIDNKRKVPLDVQLMELSEKAGVEITEKDLFDHIENMELKRNSDVESDLKTKFKSKFYELTGKELTPALAREIVKDFNSKNIEKYEQYITRENLTADAEEQLYYEGIKNGTIPTFDSERYGNVPRDKKISKGTKTNKTIKENDSKNISGIQSGIREGEKPVSTESDKGTGSQEIGSNRMVQSTPEEDIIAHQEMDKIENDISTIAKEKGIKLTDEQLGQAAHIHLDTNTSIAEAIDFVNSKKVNKSEKIIADKDIRSKFDEAMSIEKAIKEETDMGKIRELKRKNKEFRNANPGIAETMNKFKAITDKLAEEKNEQGESILKKSDACP